MPDDWNRFQLYAERVRELSLIGDLDLGADFLKMIKCYFPRGKPVFPYLRTVQFLRNNTDAEFVLCLSTLLHPGVQAVETFPPSTDSMAAMLSYMQLRCPDVQQLCITKATGLLPMFDLFSQLRTLDYDNPEDSVNLHLILPLARLPRLRKLTITSRFTSSLHTEPSTGALRLFPSLEDLSLENIRSLQAVSDLLRRVHSPSLHFVSFAYNKAPKAKDLRDLSSSLSPHEQLHILSLKSRHLPDNSIKVADLGDLLRLKRLTEVRLTDVLCPSSMDAAAIGALTCEWNDLHTLHIECKPWHEPSKRDAVCVPNVAVLGSLAVNCPHLQHLHLALSTAYIPERCNLDNPAQRRDVPLRLSICTVSGSSNEGNAHEVAEYISDIYPHIDISYETTSVSGVTLRAQWEEIKRILALMARIRPAERRRVELEMLELVERVCRTSTK